MNSLRISDAAAATGIPATTLRYWEQAGLLSSARTESGYRVYDERDLERLRFIRAAKHLELPLESIADLVRAWDGDTCATVKTRMRPMIRERLEQVQAGLEELAYLADTLRAGLASLSALPDRNAPCDPNCAFLADGLEPVPEPVLACTLTSAERDKQLARWSALRGGGTLTRNGLAAQLTLPAELAADAAAVVVAEQACCPFLGFTLSFTGSTVTLTVNAPNADAQPFVDALLGGVDGCGGCESSV